MNPWQLLLELLGGVLAFFYQVIPIYGISIILLTITVGIILFPLTLKQTRSMRAMQEIQPEVKRLQKEHKGDREELNKQLMDLYKERGVNPAAGCLPLILRMPVWFALFSVLRNPSGSLPPDSDLAADVIPAEEALTQMLETDTLDLADPVFEAVNFLGLNLLVNPGEAFGNVPFIGFLPYAILILLIVGAGYYQQLQTTRRSKKNPNPTATTAQAETMQRRCERSRSTTSVSGHRIASGIPGNPTPLPTSRSRDGPGPTTTPKARESSRCRSGLRTRNYDHSEYCRHWDRWDHPRTELPQPHQRTHPGSYRPYRSPRHRSCLWQSHHRT